jgi:LPS sulfotransferase NodH/putative sterol carrier protein
MTVYHDNSPSAGSPVGWERPPVLSCVICSMPRSGSNLLSYALEDTGLVGRPREYFGARNEIGYAAEWGLPRRYSLGSYLKKLAAESITPNGAWGAHIHLFDFMDVIGRAREEYGETLGERELLEICFPNPRCIFIRRADRVRQSISWLRAADSEQWLRLRGEPVSDRMTRLDINFDEVDEWVKVFGEQESKWRDFFARNNLSAYELTYEDLVTDYQATVLGVLDYLGLMPHAGLQLPAPRLEKQSDDLTERAVATYMNRMREATASHAENQAKAYAMSTADNQPEKGSQVDVERNTPAKAFRVLDQRLRRPAASRAKFTASYLFQLTGESGGNFHVLVRDGLGSAGAGSIDDPDLTVAMSTEDFMALVRGDLDAEFAYVTGRLTMRGDQAVGPLLGSLLNDV